MNEDKIIPCWHSPYNTQFPLFLSEMQNGKMLQTYAFIGGGDTKLYKWHITSDEGPYLATGEADELEDAKREVEQKLTELGIDTWSQRP